MEDKIEVGEYVRTKNGIIDQIEIYEETANGVRIISCKGDKNKDTYNYIKFNNIVKHSKNIINLIKEGDVIAYFSNSLGIYIKCEVSYACPRQGDYESGVGYVSTVLDDLIRIEDIKSIVTKEQFNSIKYEIE